MTTATAIVAQIIKDGQRLHAESYDKAAAEAASAKHRAEHPGDLCAGLIDFEQFYGVRLDKAMEQAAAAAGEPNLWWPLYLLVRQGWNDVHDWAEDPEEATREVPTNDDFTEVEAS